MIYDSIYSKSPLYLQNIFISLYGCKLYFERYYQAYNKFLDTLLKDQWLSKNIIHENENIRFMNMINHVWDSVPYYKDIFLAHGITKNSVRNIDDLVNLPILKKESIRTKSEEMLSHSINKKNIITLNTSGSSGKSLKIFMDLESRRKAYAFVTRYHRWAGLKNSRNNVTLAGRTIIPQGQKSKVFWRYNAVMSNYLFSTYHMSDQNLPYYVEKIRNVAPNYIDSYPSAVYLLAKYMCQHGITDICPKAILTSGETLFDYQRELIEKVFNCQIFDQYGCTEQALFVSQCEKGTYHVHPEYGVVEILDDKNKPVGKGQIGRVVCTSFTNMAMPLIRYDLGDTASFGEYECDCGRNFPVLEKLCGRIDDYIITPEGNRVGRLDPVFKGLSSVKFAQMIQKEYGKLIVKIVPGNNYVEEDKDRILFELYKRVGNKMHIEIIIVNEIEQSANGKFRTVICEIQ